MFVAAAALASAIAAIWDWRTQTIPNWLTYPALALGLVGHFVEGALRGGVSDAFRSLAFAVAGTALCGLVPLVMSMRLDAMGGGDVKLFAAIGALLLPMVGLAAEVYAFATAALLAPIALAYQGRLLVVLKNSAVLFVNAFVPEAKRRPIATEALSKIRFGPAIFAGVAASAFEWWSTR